MAQQVDLYINGSCHSDHATYHRDASTDPSKQFRARETPEPQVVLTEVDHDTSLGDSIILYELGVL